MGALDISFNLEKWFCIYYVKIQGVSVSRFQNTTGQKMKNIELVKLNL